MSEAKNGALSPNTVTVIGGSDGTNARALKVGSDGTLTATATNPSVGTTGSAVPTSATLIGGTDGTNTRAVSVSTAGVVSVDPTAGRTILYAKIDAASSGNNTVIAAVTSKKITVLGYVIVADGAVTAQWQDGASGTALSGAMSLAANGGVSAHMGGLPMMQGSANTLLNLSLGGAVGVRGHISYYTV